MITHFLNLLPLISKEAKVMTSGVSTVCLLYIFTQTYIKTPAHITIIHNIYKPGEIFFSRENTPPILNPVSVSDKKTDWFSL